MAFHIDFADQALLQIEDLFDWIAEWSPDRADEWQDGLFKKIESLKSFPRSHPQASDRAGFTGEIRELLYWDRQTAYRVIFRIKEEAIQILGVRHSVRGPS